MSDADERNLPADNLQQFWPIRNVLVEDEKLAIVQMPHFVLVTRTDVRLVEILLQLVVAQLKVQRVQQSANLSSTQMPGVIAISAAEQMPQPLIGDLVMRP